MLYSKPMAAVQGGEVRTLRCSKCNNRLRRRLRFEITNGRSVSRPGVGASDSCKELVELPTETIAFLVFRAYEKWCATQVPNPCPLLLARHC